MPLPAGIDYPPRQGLGIAGLAGWMPVRERGGLAAGETVVVLGAGGAVGQVAIQAARDGDAGGSPPPPAAPTGASARSPRALTSRCQPTQGSGTPCARPAATVPIS